MKSFKYFITGLIGIMLVANCQDDTAIVGDLIAPTNVAITTEIVGADASNPNGDGSGTVNFTVTADNALAYHFVYNGETTLANGGEMTYNFSTTGLHTYTITVIAYGTGGNSTSKSVQVDVLALYEAPADLLEMLVGSGTRTWRIKAETNGHFGLGPIGGSIPTEWYGAGANEKDGVGMYDDRYIFNADGTFAHITNNTNDDPIDDVSGTVFGRKGLIDELNGAGGTENGDDIENYAYSDYAEQWTLSAPDSKETLSLTGKAFLGYYTGGNHKYEIFSRSPTEMVLRTTDGNTGFDWWFILTNQEADVVQTVDVTYTNLIWEDNFDTDGVPNAANWTYDTGAGGWGNNESQYYTDRTDNVTVTGGVLKITAKAESFSGSDYTSARVKSQGLFDFTYGRIDVRAKLPEGGGTWPAIWTLGSNFETDGWPASGEIDIMEHVGNDQGVIHGTIHTPSSSGSSVNTGSSIISDVSAEFHVYSVNWSADEISFLIDDEIFYTYKPAVKDASTWPFDADQFIILNVAMGGNFGGAIDAAFTASSMEVDYVKVYQ